MNNPTHQTGHLYAIKFSSGTVKVGRSTDVTRRIATHVAAAAAHGTTAECIWISEPVDRLDRREQELLAFCRAHWRLTAGGEHFRNADIAQIVQQANRSGAATREVQGGPLPGPGTGTTYGRRFRGLPAEASEVRAWVARRAGHPDAPTVAHELFLAVLASGAEAVEVTLSTADIRLRVTATGPAPLPDRHSHGPGWRIVAGLSRQTGMTTDLCGLWAQMENGR